MKLALWFGIFISLQIIVMLHPYPEIMGSWSGIWQLIFIGIIGNCIVHLFIVIPSIEKHNAYVEKLRKLYLKEINDE